MKRVMLTICLFVSWVITQSVLAVEPGQYHMKYAPGFEPFSDMSFTTGEADTLNITFTTVATSWGNIRIWFQIKQDFYQLGSNYSDYLGEYNFTEPTTMTIHWIPAQPHEWQLPKLPMTDNTVYMVDPYLSHQWPTSWYFGITPVHDDFNWNWQNALTGQLNDIHSHVPIPTPGALLLGAIGVGIIGWLRRINLIVK